MASTMVSFTRSAGVFIPPEHGFSADLVGFSAKYMIVRKLLTHLKGVTAVVRQSVR